MGREVGRVVLIVGLVMQSTPVAWAQLADIDPALNAAVEALVLADPEVSSDPELAQLCRSVAESTVTDIRERIAVAQEVGAMQREGVDVRSIIPDAVRETAREKFTQVQGEMQRELERMRSLGVDPEKAKEMELRMREGERQMIAFQGGERYVPSTEMVSHAQEMFSNWEAGMVAQGAPAEFVEQARTEMARWSSGEMATAFGGPGHEFGGPMMGGPGGPGGMPSAEQMQAMGMTAEQIQMAQSQGGQAPLPSMEQMQAMGMTADQIQAAQAAMEQGHTGSVYAGTWEGGSNYGINPATGGWEPGMGGAVPGGGMTDWGAGGGAQVGYTDWSAGGGTYTGSWEGGSNYGINPATGGWEPGMGGTTYTGGWEGTSTGGTTYTGGWEGTATGGTVWEGTHTETYTTPTTDSQQAAQDRQAEMVAHKLIETHQAGSPEHPNGGEEHWDGNGDNIVDHVHPLGTAPH